MDKICSTCAMYSAEQQGCVRTQTREKPNNTCSHWTTEIPTCDVCGRPFLPPIAWIQDKAGRLRSMCPNCFNARNTCQLCAHGRGCAFKESPINIPPIINQTVRQGNMIMTNQVPNPARIEATCKSGCKCCDDNRCNRQYGTCANFTFVLDKEGEE